MLLAQTLHDDLRLQATVLHGHAGAAHQITVMTFVENLGQLAPQHGDGGAVAVGGIDAGTAQFEDRPLQLAEAVEVKLLFAVEAAQARGGLMVEQAGGGHQLAAAEVAHADVLAVQVELVHVQTQFGALEAGGELVAEHAVAQRLGFAQGHGAGQALGLQAAGLTRGNQGFVTAEHDLGHGDSPGAGGSGLAAGRSCCASSG